MNRLSKIAALTVLGFVSFLLLIWAARVVHARHVAKQEHMAELESKVQDLLRASHPRWRIRQGWFSITTTDRPQISQYSGDFRLVYGTNAVQKFEKTIWKEPGHIETAWVSDWTPRSEIYKFDELSISNTEGASFVILAKAHTNESVAMKFIVTFIVE